MPRLIVVPCLNAHERHVRDPLYSFSSLLELRCYPSAKRPVAGLECERGDSNPHGTKPQDPKSCASTNSATFANVGHGIGRAPSLGNITEPQNAINKECYLNAEGAPPGGNAP